MSKSNGFETSLLNHIFNNAAISNIGDAAGLPAGTQGSLYVALYTSDPTDADTGTEATYGGYARVAVARTAGGWTVSGDTVSNTALIQFPEGTSGPQTITHWGIRTAAAAGDLLYHGSVGTSRTADNGVTLEFAAGTLTVTEG